MAEAPETLIHAARGGDSSSSLLLLLPPNNLTWRAAREGKNKKKKARAAQRSARMESGCGGGGGGGNARRAEREEVPCEAQRGANRGGRVVRLRANKKKEEEEEEGGDGDDFWEGKIRSFERGGEWNWNGVGDGVRSRCRVDDVWGGLARWPPPALSGRLGFGCWLPWWYSSGLVVIVFPGIIN